MFFTLSQIVSHMSGNLYHKGFREADEIVKVGYQNITEG